MTATKEETVKKNNESTESKKKYDKILDDLIEMIGGKEYCLRQLICEGEHKNFIKKYKEDNKKFILDQISKFYDSVPYDEKNIIDVEISNALWNKYIMKIYFYDKENHKFFEFSVKTSKVEEQLLFETLDTDCDNSANAKTYPKSFFSKLKEGVIMWEKYSKVLETKNMEEYEEKVQKEKEYFLEKMKKFKIMDQEDLESVGLLEAPEQYRDGKTRYIANNIFYYQLVGIDGYITFDDGKDIMLDPTFARHFYEKIVKRLREQ
jgi:hypothetical protein